MDVFVSGPNIGNLAVTLGLVALLLVLSTKSNILDRNGALAAALLGLVVGGLGHWTWLIILLGFLLSSHKATKWRFEEKLALGLSESNDGHRGWTNVVANGAIPGFMCLIAIAVRDGEAMVWLFGASVAVAAADTFASEIGSLDPRVRMITTLRRCEQGLNGGFSPNGQIAALVGSSVVAGLTFVAWFLTTNGAGAGLNGVSLAIALAIVGWVGCQIDSLLGALLENRGYLTKGSVNALSIAGGVVIMLAVLAQSS